MAPRVALITGCAQGIGKGIALRLAKDGYNLALNDLPSKKEQLQAIADIVKQSGTKVAIVCADISKEKEVEGMVAATVSKLGSLDIVSSFFGSQRFDLSFVIISWLRMRALSSSSS